MTLLVKDKKVKPAIDKAGLSLTIVTVSTILILIGVLLYACFGLWVSFSTSVPTKRTQELNARLTRLDESVALSARLVAGGDNRGKKRFQDSVHEYEVALNSLANVVPLTAQSKVMQRAGVAMLSAGNKRIALEEKAVRLAESSRRGEAFTLLNSKDYTALRQKAQRTEAAYVKRTEEVLGLSPLVSRVRSLVLLVASLCGLGLMAGLRKIQRERHEQLRHEAVTAQAERRQAQEAAKRAREEMEIRAKEKEEIEEILRSQIKQVRRANTENHLLMQAILSADEVIMITDAGNDFTSSGPRIVFVNPAFERITGHAQSEVDGRVPPFLVENDCDPEGTERLRKRLETGEPLQEELLSRRKDGTTFWMEVNAQPIYDAKGWQTHWLIVQRDITSRKAAEARIQWQANHDALTGLPNRTMFERCLGEAIAEANGTAFCVGVLFFDLDRFKHINDTLGHTEGDRLLQLLAERLVSMLDAGDVIARMGGDEFTICLPKLKDPEGAAEVAQKLLNALDKPFQLDDHELYVTASIGISIAPKDGAEITTLLKNADVAMYRAKEQGRDSYRVYVDTMNAKALDRLVLEMHLRKALERNELYLQYQPQVNLQTGEVHGVEALIRWQNPQLGRVSPGQFIPLAEEMGIIVPISEWVIHEACQQAARWQRSGMPIRMSVNLSARHLEKKDLPQMINGVLRQYRLDPEWLDIELTEGTLMSGSHAIDRLGSLKTTGVRLSVDDFGTGFSSLSYLTKFPLDILKIDRSFVIGLGEEHKSEVMVRNLIEMAHGIGLEVIAEGVETEAQRDLLRQLGCDTMQGYLFSPPTSVEEVEKLVAKAKCIIVERRPLPKAA